VSSAFSFKHRGKQRGWPDQVAAARRIFPCYARRNSRLHLLAKIQQARRPILKRIPFLLETSLGERTQKVPSGKAVTTQSVNLVFRFERVIPLGGHWLSINASDIFDIG
jgi:hypothetical protein